MSSVRPTFDPLEELLELKRFAKAADQHISNLLKNQEQMVKAINSTTVVGSILLIAHILGHISGWWAVLYAPLLFMGHSIEYKDMFLWRK